MEQKCNRESYIDALKVLGLLCLFFAHVQSPAFAKEVRNFDVPLMVFLSGVLIDRSYHNTPNYKTYLWKRIQRLAFPTWIFLVVFYACMAIVGQLPDGMTILKSFLFQRDSGIAGGVWIIWIYLVCAAVAPVLLTISKSKRYWLLFLTIAILYEIAASVQALTENRWLYYTVFSIIPYGLFMSLGICYPRLGKKQKIYLLACSLSIWVIWTVCYLMLYGNIPKISDYKYPARIYYFAYALPIIIVLIEGSKKIQFSRRIGNMLFFISKHSLWMYLWQIMVLAIVNYVVKISQNWLLSYVVLIIGSFIITWVQNAIVAAIQTKWKIPFLKYLTY